MVKLLWPHGFVRIYIFQEFLNAFCGDIQFGNRGGDTGVLGQLPVGVDLNGSRW